LGVGGRERRSVAKEHSQWEQIEVQHGRTGRTPVRSTVHASELHRSVIETATLAASEVAVDVHGRVARYSWSAVPTRRDGNAGATVR
jgi:hypothetical protein